MEQPKLGFRTKTRGGPSVQGLVQNAEFHPGGADVWIDFPPEVEFPAWAVGKIILGEFHGGSLQTPLEARGRVVQRTESESSSSSYKLRFGNPVGAALTSLANRRGAVRVRPDDDAPLVVRIRWSGHEVRTSAIDISATGLAVLVQPADEALLFRAQSLELLIEPPGSNRSISVSGSVRHRRLVGATVRYGLEFDAKSPGFVAEQRCIVDYVMKRQADLLRRAVRIHG